MRNQHVSHQQLWDCGAEGLGILLCDEDRDIEGLCSPDQSLSRVYDCWVALDGGAESLLQSRIKRSASQVFRNATSFWPACRVMCFIRAPGCRTRRVLWSLAGACRGEALLMPSDSVGATACRPEVLRMLPSRSTLDPFLLLQLHSRC